MTDYPIGAEAIQAVQVHYEWDLFFFQKNFLIEFDEIFKKTSS
jgi:hypothetical protein